MAAENEIQFFEAPFQYQIGEFQSNVNLTYHKLINTRPIKMPQMNTGFETPFTQAYNEKGDKSYFGIKKREGFVDCQSLNKAIADRLGTNDFIITDHQIVDGRRFIMACDTEYKYMTILTQEKGRYIDCMPQPQDPCLGVWKPVYVAGESSQKLFNTTPCTYHKFQKISTLISEKENKIDEVYIGIVVMEGGSTTAVAFNKDRTPISGMQTGKFIQAYDSLNNDIVLGQALQVGQFDANNGWYNMGYGSWLGVTDEIQEPLYDDLGNKIGVLNYQGPVSMLVYDGIGQGIAFTAEWKGDRNGVFEWNGSKFVYIKQTQLSHTHITSMTEDYDGLVYTTDKGYLYFLRPHTNYGQSLGGTIYSSNYMYGGWDLAKACGDYVFLFGPDSIGIAFKRGTDERGDYIRGIQVLDRSLGYWNKDSVLVYNEELFMIDNKKRFVKLDLEVTTNKSYNPTYKLIATDMSLHRVNTDLRNLDREQGQKVSLCKDDYRIYIIINDSEDNDSLEDVKNTKILVYEDELKYRHWWYLCGIDIRYFSEGQWIGEGLRINKGEVDDGHTFKQIISMTFGDTSWFTWKEVLWIKAAIGYHSKISKNTIFKFRADGGGYSKTIKMNTLETSAYIKAINELRESGKTDINDFQNIYRAMPIGIGIYSGNGVGLIEDIYRTDKVEFDKFCNYEPTMTYKKDTCCDAKPASEPSDNGCTMKAPDADKENFGSDRFQYHFNIAKYGTIPIDIGQQGQNFYLEIIANEYDAIEFMGFMIGWMFMDNSFDAIANKPYYQTTPKDSLPGTI